MSDVTYEGQDLSVLAEMPNYYGWIFETFAPYVRGRVVEYGAGTGTVSARLAALGESLTAVEPSANLIQHLSARFASDPAVRVAQDTLENHAPTLQSGTIDTIVMVNVLEHIEDDRAALAQLLRCLKRGGHLLLFVPALRALMSKLDLLHGHFRRYHRNDLLTKVSEAGGTVIDCRYFDLIGTVPWFLLNTLGGSTGFNPMLVRVNDRIVVPVSRVLEKAVRPPLGKNLILVAQKP